MSMADSSEVVIVGGGAAGCSVAYYLALAGFKATIIEEAGLGTQASGFSAGGLNPLQGAGIPGPLGALAIESYGMHLALWDELKEETGLTAARWEELMRLHTSNSITDELGIVYVARELTEGLPEFGETEDLAIETIPFTEALERVLRGKITDAVSVASILRLWAERERFLGRASDE